MSKFLNFRDQAFLGHVAGSGGGEDGGEGDGSGILSGLIGYWPLGELSGDRVDYTGCGSALHETGGSVASASGKVGNCASFTSTNYLLTDRPLAALALDKAFSFAVWIKLSLPTGDPPQITLLTFNGFTLKAIGNRFDSVVLMQGYSSLIGHETSFETGVFIREFYLDDTGGPDTWFFWVYTLQLAEDGASGVSRMSINGGDLDSAGTDFGGFITGATLDLTIAGDDIGQVLKRGLYLGSEVADYQVKIDEVGIWNRVLTQDEITALYNAGTGKTYPLS